MAGDEDQPLKPADATAARSDAKEEEEEEMEAPEAAAASGDGREEDQAARLPEDVLAAILLRVPPCSLAASRCVCRAWRDAVDGRGLLRADLLPLSLSLAGFFVHYDEHKFPEFFARPSSSAVSGDLSFLPSASPHCGHINDEDCLDWGDYEIEDHCNGLLLLSGKYVVNLATRRKYVVNPATRRWHTLPRCPPKRGGEEKYFARKGDAYKEIVFLSASEPSKRIGLAYHLNGSKIEELGNIYSKEYGDFKELNNQREMIKSFSYTPCWIEEFTGDS